jgi:hypothetical protein
VASLISSRHKVDLTKAEKVIIVEIYQVRRLIYDNQVSSFYLENVSRATDVHVGASMFCICLILPIMERQSFTDLFTDLRWQTTCGMSVVGGDWENLKRYNLAEIYQQTSKPVADLDAKTAPQATPGGVSKDETRIEL